jgi:hypothetical protein
MQRLPGYLLNINQKTNLGRGEALLDSKKFNILTDE